MGGGGDGEEGGGMGRPARAIDAPARRVCWDPGGSGGELTGRADAVVSQIEVGEAGVGRNSLVRTCCALLGRSPGKRTLQLLAGYAGLMYFLQ
jgi:hypothetical protein